METKSPFSIFSSLQIFSKFKNYKRPSLNNLKQILIIPKKKLIILDLQENIILKIYKIFMKNI